MDLLLGADSRPPDLMMKLPRLYAILDPSFFPDEEAFLFAAGEMSGSGVDLLQYRNKAGNGRQILGHAKQLKHIFEPSARLIMNDRCDLCVAAGFDGVHLGQDDLTATAARKVVGGALWIGISAHNSEQVNAADETCSNYIAIGPVFATSSKADPDPVLGVAGVRKARQLTRKPLVAIGGITRGNCLSVIDAGADSVAVISDLSRGPGKAVEEFLRILR